MRSHISVHHATTKYFSNPFVFKTRIEKEGLPRDSPAGLGAGGPEFKSRRPDQNISRVFFRLLKMGDRSSQFASRLVSESSPHAEFCKNTGRQECYSETIERTQVNRQRSGKYGENSGDPAHFSSH